MPWPAHRRVDSERSGSDNKKHRSNSGPDDNRQHERSPMTDQRLVHLDVSILTVKRKGAITREQKWPFVAQDAGHSRLAAG